MTACSQQWDEAGHPASGTAPVASFWVAVEQNGPWGREALTQSHLDPELGAQLATAAKDAGGRALLIRSQGRHADPHAAVPRRVLIASRCGERPWLATGAVDDPRWLLDLPWADLSDLDPDRLNLLVPWLAPAADPALLVCTNGTRDACCAVRGRPVALALAAEFPGQVWECSHTGGHRFAPTGILLPSGRALARLDAELGREVLIAEARGEVAARALAPQHNRGLSHQQPTGHRHRVYPDLPESCGSAPVPCWLLEPNDSAASS